MLRNLLLSAGLIVTIWVPSALAADVTGRWDVKIISTSDGEVHGVAGFTQNGNRVTGWLGPSEADPIPITLFLRENKLTIWTHPQPGRNVVFARCDVTVEGDEMSGTIDADKGTIEFIRTSHEPPRVVKFKSINKLWVPGTNWPTRPPNLSQLADNRLLGPFALSDFLRWSWAAFTPLSAYERT
jgi:hypothetical protein